MDRRKCVTPTRLATWFEDATLAGNRDEQPGVGWSALHCPPCLHCVTDQARPNRHAFWCRSVPGCQQSRGRGLIADCCTLKEFGLCISTSLRNNNTISTAFKVLVPVFLLWRDSTAFLSFHLHPHTPRRNVKVWHAFAYSFSLQSPRHTWRACAAVGNGKDFDAWVSLAEPGYKLSLFFVLCWDSIHSRVRTR